MISKLYIHFLYPIYLFPAEWAQRADLHRRKSRCKSMSIIISVKLANVLHTRATC